MGTEDLDGARWFLRNLDSPQAVYLDFSIATLVKKGHLQTGPGPLNSETFIGAGYKPIAHYSDTVNILFRKS